MSIEETGGYRILGPLSRRPDGGSLLGEDPEDGRPVVVRRHRLPPGAEQRAEAVRSFAAEARALEALDHPALARLLDHGEDRDFLWWVEERVDGIPLDRYAAGREPLAGAIVVELVALAAEALAAAHAASIVHRGLTPSRLLRCREGGIKVAGFRPGSGHGVGARARDVRDARYVAPEQVRGGVGDARCDLFSLGSILYELLTGELPFPGESESSVVYRVVHEPPTDPTSVRLRRVGPELARFLERALAKAPDARYPDGESFARALRQAWVRESVDRALAGPSATEVPPAREREAGVPRGRTARFIAATFVLVGIGASAAWLLRDRLLPSRPPPAVWFEATVRTQPPNLDVLRDGEPLSLTEPVRFSSAEPFPLLSARHACRVVQHRLEPADAGQVVVLVADPVELEWTVDPNPAGAEVWLNGERAGSAPLRLRLDLCRDNRLELRASGHRPAAIPIPAGATPLEARKLLYDVALEPIPQGRLVLPEVGLELVIHVDGRRLEARERELVLDEGEHELRYLNAHHWVEGAMTVAVRGGETVTPELTGVELATLVVQAFPANCKVYLRRPGGAWRLLDETPVSRRVATGPYEVKVVLAPTGETQVRKIELSTGDNPPVRVAFRSGG